MDKRLPQRKTTRLQGHDYSSTGAYFLTVRVSDSAYVLSRIELSAAEDVGENISESSGPLHPPFFVTHTELTEYGRVAEKYLLQLCNFYDELTLKHYVILPDHMHVMLLITESGPPGTSVRTPQNTTLSKFLSTFKRSCHKELGINVWKPRSYDRVIRDREEYALHIKYMYEKPVHWYYRNKTN